MLGAEADAGSAGGQPAFSPPHLAGTVLAVKEGKNP